MASQSTCMLVTQPAATEMPTLRRLGDTNYQYEDLTPENNEIRLLHIQTGTYDSPMSCRIQRVSLDNPPSFMAISYAWGDPEDTCLMILDGQEFPLTRSLNGALQALRSVDSEVVVWADAICINQFDNTEKSLQVRNMTKVYAAAKKTCLWLGPEEDSSAQGLVLLDELALQTAQTIKPFIMTDFSSCFGQIWALVEIFERAYWNRLWCLQEIVSSINIVVYCGRHITDWWKYVYVQSLFRSLQPSLDQLLPFSSNSSHTWASVLARLGPGSMPSEITEKSLTTLLHNHRTKLCMNPRDRVYAILGLIAGQRTQLSIDYKISVRSLFTNVIKYAVEENNKVNSICYSTPRRNNQFALPSWVPDWMTGEEHLPLINPPFSFAASGDTPTDAVFLDRNSKLQISALRIDEIDEVYIQMPGYSSSRHMLIIIHAWRADICRQLGYDLVIHDSFAEVISLGNKFPRWSTRQWTTIFNYILDRSMQHYRPDLVADNALLDALNRYDNLPLLDEGYMDHFARYIRDSLVNRQLSRTQSSLLCMSTGLLQRGDQIFVLAGCSVPVLLRRLNGNEYKFVGEIYVNGYMHGRAMEECATGMRTMQTVVLV